MTKNILIKSSIGVVICLLIGFLASTATQGSLDSWYADLEKPFFHPPDQIFSPVWGVLYVLMGIAAGIVWSKGFYHKWVKVALYHFGFQLILNGFWTILFFGLQKPFLALLDIIALFVLLLITIKWFRIVSETAAYLLYPYALWLLFAAALNFEIWRLNYW